MSNPFEDTYGLSADKITSFLKERGAGNMSAGIETCYDTGYEDGYDDGQCDGFSDGYDNGFEDGLREGIDSGYEDGYDVGVADGHYDGKNEGVKKGLIIASLLFIAGKFIKKFAPHIKQWYVIKARPWYRDSFVPRIKSSWAKVFKKKSVEALEDIPDSDEQIQDCNTDTLHQE